MKRLRQSTSLTPDSVDQSIDIASDHFERLLNALIQKPLAADLRTSAIEQALQFGIFLIYDPVTNAFAESPTHGELSQTLDDIQRLRKLESLENWEENVFKTVSRAISTKQSFCRVGGSDLTATLAFYDRLEDIFNGHVALCKVLLGLTDDLPQYERRPLTLLGEGEEQNIRAELISPVEVEHLIQNAVWPFGTRLTATLHRRARERLIQSLVQDLSRAQTEGKINAGLDALKLRTIAQKVVDDIQASQEEGIEEIPRRPCQDSLQ